MKVYCQWVDKIVDEKEVSQKYCMPHVRDRMPPGVDGIVSCERCGKSPQLRLASEKIEKKKDELLGQLREYDQW